MKTITVASTFLRTNTFYAIAWCDGGWECAIAGTHFDAELAAWRALVERGFRFLFTRV